MHTAFLFFEDYKNIVLFITASEILPQIPKVMRFSVLFYHIRALEALSVPQALGNKIHMNYVIYFWTKLLFFLN